MSEKKSPELKRWEDACLEWRYRLDLWDWRFTFEVVDSFDGDTADRATAGRNVSTPAYKEATVRVRRTTAREASDDDLRELACHEMFHSVFVNLDVFVGTVIEQIPEPACEMVKEHWREEMESFVTRMQRTLCRPWITWSDGPERDPRPGAP